MEEERSKLIKFLIKFSYMRKQDVKQHIVFKSISMFHSMRTLTPTCRIILIHYYRKRKLYRINFIGNR